MAGPKAGHCWTLLDIAWHCLTWLDNYGQNGWTLLDIAGHCWTLWTLLDIAW